MYIHRFDAEIIPIAASGKHRQRCLNIDTFIISVFQTVLVSTGNTVRASFLVHQIRLHGMAECFHSFLITPALFVYFWHSIPTFQNICLTSIKLLTFSKQYAIKCMDQTFRRETSTIFKERAKTFLGSIYVSMCIVQVDDNQPCSSKTCIIIILCSQTNRPLFIIRLTYVHAKLLQLTKQLKVDLS